MAGDTEQLMRWLEAVGVSSDDETSAAVSAAVAKAGKFLVGIGSLPDAHVCDGLAGIDFDHPPIVVRLPNSVFVRHDDVASGMWLTDTGLSAEAAKPLAGRTTRKLFYPMGPVPAMRATPVSPLVCPHPAELFRGVTGSARSELSKLSQRGGTHYCVPIQSMLRELR